LEAKKKTFIVISHRLRTIKNSNLIAVISAGQIQEIGSHDELIRKEDGIYHKLTSMINENVD
jgi:ABC-type multidrug transport system fused ATPase/permease subunit